MSDLTTGGGQPAAPGATPDTARLLEMAAGRITQLGYTCYPDDEPPGIDVIAAFWLVAPGDPITVDTLCSAFAGWLLLTDELPGTLNSDCPAIISRWESKYPGHGTDDVVSHLLAASSVITTWSVQ